MSSGGQLLADATRRAAGSAAMVCAFLLLGVALAACGSASSSSGGAKNASNKAGGAVAPANLAKAKAVAAKESATPTSVGISTPLARRPKPGTLSICYLSYLTVPVVATNTDGAEAAAKALGVKIYPYDLGTTSDQLSSALDAAVAKNCNSYWVSGGISTGLWSKQAAILKARGVPVASQGSNWPNTGKYLNYYSVQGVADTGADLVDWAIAQENGKPVNMLVVSPPVNAFTVFGGTGPAVKQRMASLCPSCQVTVMYLPASEEGTTAPTKVASFLEAHPQYNYVLGLLDFNTGLPTALKVAGLASKVKLLGFVGGATELGYVKDGAEAADLQYDDVGQGWLTVDALVRGMTGQSMAPDQAWQASTQIVTQSTARLCAHGFWCGVPNTPQHYYALWGCSSAGACPGVKP